MKSVWLYLKNLDWIMFSAVALLVIFGLVEIYSVALGQGSLNLLNFRKQLIFAAFGFIALFFFVFVDYRFLRGLSRYLYLLAALILVLVLIFGETIRGTKGWFNFFGLGFQPVEFVKIVLIIFLSDYFTALAAKVKTMRQFIISGSAAMLLIFLVLMQPDFGSSLMLLFVWMLLLFVSGFKKKYFIWLAIGGLLVATIAWFGLFKEYQKERIMTFLNPSANSLESGYNVSQAMIAVGSGGLSGKGVGFGSQSQLKFLPEAQTDFIFAVISEELGFVGVALVLAFYFIFFSRALTALRKINSDYGLYFITAASGLIFIQMFINIGMNLGIMPVVGLPLPFISYGGSSLVFSLALVGMVENVIIKSKINY